MIVSINQPAYLPWPGFFDRILKSDLHIILDHVQFEKNSLTNRNKVKTPQGWSWVTVPVRTKGKFKDCALSNLEINNEVKWAHKHHQNLISNYSKAPFFNDYKEFLDDVYGRDWPLLLPLLEETNDFLIESLGIKTETVKSSSLSPEAQKSDLVLELCQKVEATTYLSGPLGRDYLDVESFEKVGIKILYHDYEPPEYSQLYGDFEPYMSVVDMLFNIGPDSHERLQNPPESLKQA